MMLTFVRVPWHAILATVIVALLVAALPQATDAATRRERCLTAAENALGRAIEPSDYRIVLGTNKAEETLWASRAKDLICGFSGTEYVRGVIRHGDILIRGAGGSAVWAASWVWVSKFIASIRRP